MPDSCTPTTDERNCTKNRLPACVSFKAQRAIRMGSIGPRSVVRMPVGRNANWAARISLLLEDGWRASTEGFDMRSGFQREAVLQDNAWWKGRSTINFG